MQEINFIFSQITGTKFPHFSLKKIRPAYFLDSRVIHILFLVMIHKSKKDQYC